MPPISTPPARLTVTQVAQAMGISRTTFYVRGWDEVFTRFTLPGGKVRICSRELEEYLKHTDWARGRAAVLALRKEMERLPATSSRRPRTTAGAPGRGAPWADTASPSVEARLDAIEQELRGLRELVSRLVGQKRAWPGADADPPWVG